MYALWNSTTGHYSFSTTNNGGVLITTAQYQALLTGESQGSKIIQGASGIPALQDIVITLEESREQQIATLSSACQEYLLNGFKSSALGSEYVYPSNTKDQQNFACAAATESTAYLWCSTGDVWSLTVHTAAQVKQVNTDWMTYLNAAQAKLVSLITSVNTCATASAISMVVW